MKVFEAFYYNLNQIRFKQNKLFIDDELKKQGLEYTDISFIFRGDMTGDVCKKTLKLFPKLEEYLFHYTEAELHISSREERGFSSVFLKQDGTLNHSVKREHHQVFAELLTKIPHSVNFDFMGVMLDNVNWYEDGCTSVALLNKGYNYIINDHKFDNYLSNSVRFYKEFDYGNKRNYIGIMIERTKDGEALREYPEKYKEFIKAFGKPYFKELICGFDESERKALETSKQTIEAWKKSKDYSYHFAGFEKYEYNLEDAITPVSGYSPKTVLNKVAKTKGYKYKSCVNGFYTFEKANANNHTFVVEFNFKPFSLYADVSISVKGYNLVHYIYTYRDISTKDKDILESYAKAAFEAASEIESDISKKLLDLYGKTPDWFI